MGDSNAARLAGDRGKANIRKEGAGTNEILKFAQQLQRAAQPAAVRPQTNAGYQLMSNNTTTQTNQLGVRDPFSPTGAVSTDSAQTPSLAPQQARSRNIQRTMEQRNGRSAVVIGTPKMQPAPSGGGGSSRIMRSGGTNAVAVLNSISRVILAYT
jgi:hypothetical protein